MAAVPLSNLQNGAATGAVIAAVNHAGSNETAASVLAAQAKAIVESRYIVAFNRPRDVEAARQKILKECMRPGFAAAARYNKPVGKGIKGPSIRFAEVAIRCMTNIVVETAAIYDDREQRIVRVSVTDLESNVPYSQDVTVRKAVERRHPRDGDVVLRQRTNSYGDKVYLIEATDDEILNQQNALISKAIRTLGLRLIPGDIIDEAMELCIRVQMDEDAKDPNAAKRKIIDGFGDVGVTVEQLREYLGHDLDKLQPKELQDLRGLYAALRDGETTWREIMDSRKPAKKPDEKPAQKEPAAKPPIENFQKADEASKESAEGEPPFDDDNAARPSIEEITKSIAAAKTVDALQSVVDLIDEIRPESKQAMLLDMATNKMKRLKDATESAEKKNAEPERAESRRAPRSRMFE